MRKLTLGLQSWKANKFVQVIFASLLFLLITTIYLFPAFLGKVDTPVDIRDGTMYPWAYYSTDKKLKIHTLWEAKFPQNTKVFDSRTKEHLFNLFVIPQAEELILLDIKLDKSLSKKLDKNNDVIYYFVFDFKTLCNEPQNFRLYIDLKDKITNGIYRLPIEILSSSKITKKDDVIWQRGYLPLKIFLKDFKSLEYLNDHSLQIKGINKSKRNSASIYIKNLKLIGEDYSNALKVKSVVNNDLIQSFTPFRKYFSESLKKGKLPFWNNYILTGAEFLSEPQVGYFHPIYIFLYLLFDHFSAHMLITFLFLSLCGLGAFLLCRFWGLAFEVSLFTGIVYMFHPFNAAWMSYEHVLMNSAALPFLLISYQKSLSVKKLLNKEIIYSTFLLGLIFLSGHLQVVYYTVLFFFLFCVFYFLIDWFSINKNPVKHIFSILFVFSISLLIAAIVLIPFFPNFVNSHRVGISKEIIIHNSIPLDAFKSLIYPFYRKSFMQEYVYFGLIPFLLSIFSLLVFVFSKYKTYKSLVIFLYFTLIISILIFTGSPFFFWIKDLLPGFKQLQQHRFLEVYSYCVPFLCGVGLQLILNTLTFIRGKIKLVLMVLIFLHVSFDLMSHSSYFVTWSDRASYKRLEKGGSLEFLSTQRKKSREPFRTAQISPHQIGKTKFKVDVAVPNTLMPYDIEEVSGYSSFIDKDLYALLLYLDAKDLTRLYTNEIVYFYENINIPYAFRNYKSKILDILNVKYFFVPSQFELLSNDVLKVFSGDCNIYENKNYLPRAFVVSNHRVVSSNKETIVELDSERFDPREEVILMIAPGVIASSGFRPPRNDITFLNYDINNIKLKVDTNRASFLVLGHNLNNNWKVKINDKEGELLQANLVQRAVYLPKAGNYLLEFYYFPRLYLIGFSITVLAVIFLVFLMLFLINLEKSGSKKDFQLGAEEKEKKLISV